MTLQESARWRVNAARTDLCCDDCVQGLDEAVDVAARDFVRKLHSMDESLGVVKRSDAFVKAHRALVDVFGKRLYGESYIPAATDEARRGVMVFDEDRKGRKGKRVIVAERLDALREKRNDKPEALRSDACAAVPDLFKRVFLNVHFATAMHWIASALRRPRAPESRRATLDNILTGERT